MSFASDLKSKEPRLRDWNKVKVRGYDKAVSLEIKRTSITRLKPVRIVLLCPCYFFLKSKEPRLRDWNETLEICECALVLKLEIKRTSITRLKPEAPPIFRHTGENLKSKEPRLRDWNCSKVVGRCRHLQLEIKRTSITRLKPLEGTR